MVEAREADREGQSCLVQGNEYILDSEQREENKALQKVNYANINELSSLLTTFGERLNNPDDDFDPSQQTGLSNLINKRKQQMKEYEEQKIKIVSEADDLAQNSVQDLEKLYRSTALALSQWIETSVALIKDTDINESKFCLESKRGTGLKLDSLSLPVFHGNVRHFARFLLENLTTL